MNLSNLTEFLHSLSGSNTTSNQYCTLGVNHWPVLAKQAGGRVSPNPIIWCYRMRHLSAGLSLGVGNSVAILYRALRQAKCSQVGQRADAVRRDWANH